MQNIPCLPLKKREDPETADSILLMKLIIHNNRKQRCEFLLHRTAFVTFFSMIATLLLNFHAWWIICYTIYSYSWTVIVVLRYNCRNFLKGFSQLFLAGFVLLKLSNVKIILFYLIYSQFSIFLTSCNQIITLFMILALSSHLGVDWLLPLNSWT